MRKPITEELRQPPERRGLPRVGGVGQGSGQLLMTPRERMWAAMLKLTNKSGQFAPVQVEDLAHPVTLDAVTDYLEALEKAGLAVKCAEQGNSAAGFVSSSWRLTVNWPAAPRINKAGSVVTQGLGVLAMWRAARIRKQFRPSELAADASVGAVKVTLATAKQYCLALERSGHFAFVAKGKGGIESVYRIARDTGPHAPAVTRSKVVFDRNAGTLHCVQTAAELINEMD